MMPKPGSTSAFAGDVSGHWPLPLSSRPGLAALLGGEIKYALWWSRRRSAEVLFTRIQERRRHDLYL